MKAPLEAVGKRIRQGQKIDLGFLKSLTKRKRLGIVVAAVAVGSFVLAVEIRSASYWNLYKLIKVRSATSVREHSHVQCFHCPLYNCVSNQLAHASAHARALVYCT
jgi:hypothetical protein